MPREQSLHTEGLRGDAGVRHVPSYIFCSGLLCDAWAVGAMFQVCIICVAPKYVLSHLPF